MLAEITPDGRRIGCATEFRHKDLIKSIPGARFDAALGLWVLRLSWSSCLALRATFGAALEIGPELGAWAAAHRSALIDPALALRGVVASEDGDPVLFPHQRVDVEFLTLVRRAILASTMGTGKGLVPETPVLTPTGWVPAGTVRPGDRLVGRDGNRAVDRRVRLATCRRLRRAARPAAALRA